MGEGAHLRGLKFFFALIASVGIVQPLFAQDYPTRPVRILVQFSPGGIPDLAARVLADRLSQAFGKPFIVENRTGSSGNIATDFVARSDPDGYTLLFSSSAPLTMNPALFKKLPFDAGKDFAPVSLVGSFEFVLMAAPGFPPNSVSEVVALAKPNPNKFNIASSGYGSEHHLAGELFNIAAGIHLTHVPYKGFAPATVDVMANHVELMFGSVPASLPFIRSGKLKPLATSGTAREVTLPNVPTFAEAGYPDVKVISWVGLLAPARTPKSVLERLTAETVKVVQSSEFRQRLETVGVGSMPVGPEALDDRIDTDQKFWARVVKEAGIKQVE